MFLGYILAALIFGDDGSNKPFHLDHLISQMDFVNPGNADTTDLPLTELAHYLKIHARHTVSIMTFLNKHVQFAPDRYALAKPPRLTYTSEQVEFLDAARVLVSLRYIVTMRYLNPRIRCFSLIR